MKTTKRLSFMLFLLVSFLACAAPKQPPKRFLDVDTLMSAEESTYLPFTIEERRVQEVKELFSKDNLPVRPYKVDFTTKMVVPEKVKYKAIPNEQNEKIINDFFTALKPPVKLTQVQENKRFIMGPHLTALLQKSGVLSNLEYRKVVAPFYYFKRQDVLVECTIMPESMPQVFNLLRNLLFSADAVTVRKMKERELDWYWATISYDIDEPIFILENAKHKILIHFTPEGKIFFLDLFDGLNW